jgi:formylglycine-generating enzyme required for sulfatase activity
MTKRVLSLLMVAAAAALVGCGAADLYEAPESPFHIIATVPLPSDNEGVIVLGDHAYVAGGQAGLHVIDLSDPGDPQLLETINTTKYAENVDIIRTFANQTLLDIALVVEGTEGITTYDVSDPASVTSFNQGTTAVDGNRIFVQEPEDPDEPYVVYLAESWKGVRIFESAPEFPGVLNYNGVFAGTNGYAMGIAVKDGYAYVADDQMGLAVLDVRERVLGAVQLVSWADTPGNALDVAVDGDYAFVADGTEGIAVFRIDGGATPVLVGQVDLTAYSRSIVCARGYALLCAADGGVHVVDVRDPENPEYAGSVNTGYAADLCLSPSGHVLVADRTVGLVVLAGPDLSEDTRAPAAVTTLAGTPVTSTSVRMNWQATGNDGYYGVAGAYELRYALTPILDEADWDAAAVFAGLPDPAAAGVQQTVDVTSLTQETIWHFCMKVLDDDSHVSPLSNDAVVTTPTGTFLNDPSHVPSFGETATEFTFEVTFLDAEGDEPVEHDVEIDGAAQAMAYVEGDPESGSLYRLATTLSVGTHTYRFLFDDGLGGTAVTEPLAGPPVGTVSFVMGSPAGETGRRYDEPMTEVAFTHGVTAGAHEVKQSEWNLIMPPKVFTFPGDDLPVHDVTWYEAVDYCNALSDDDGYTRAYTVDGPYVTWDRDADGWRLPTEAEWELLCRAGTTTGLPNGELTEVLCGADAVLDAIGWYCGNAPTGPQAVEQKTANAGGLYDMLGNVREWCWDWYGAYPAGPVLDPEGPASGEQRVVRGGSWHYYARDCRSAARGTFYPTSADDFVGFRVVRNQN